MAGNFNGPGHGQGPDLDQTLERLQQYVRRFTGVKGRWPWLIAAAVALWLASGIYIVGPDELGVVRRFGKMHDLARSGMHYRLPYPIDRVDTRKVAQIRSMELGFRTVSERPPVQVRPVPVESLMITGDENLVNIQVVVQYRISDLPAYLFRVDDPQGSPEGRTLRDAAETALRGVVGSMTIDDILTVGRARVQEETKAHLQQLMDQYETGLQITEVKLQAVDPPNPVQAAFKDVVSAKEDRERIINQARAYREDVLPKARGEAEQTVRAAEAYKARRVREAQGNSERFSDMLAEYRKAKDITRERLYLETMVKVLGAVDKVVISGTVGNKALPLLPLGGQAGMLPGVKPTQKTGGQQ